MSMAESNVSESSVDPLIQSQTSQADVQHSHILPGAEGGPSDNAENLEEYETQLFGFTPKSFVSGIYNSVGDCFMEVLKAIEENIAENYADVITKEELSLKMRNISKHIVAQIDKAFDILEVYLTTNIFRIPHNMVLPEDQIQMDSPVSQEELVEVQEKIALATKKILAVKLANAFLKKRLQDIMYLQETFDNLLQELQAAKSEVTKERVCGIKDTIRYCASKILGSISAMEELKDINLHVDSKYIKAIITFLEEKSEPEKEKVSNLE